VVAELWSRLDELRGRPAILHHVWWWRMSGFGVAAIPGPESWLLVVGTAGLTTIVAPFMQTLVSKAAEDTYTRLRRLFSRQRPETKNASGASTAALPDAGLAVEEAELEWVVLRDPETDTELVVPTVVPEEAIWQLVRFEPEGIRGTCLLGMNTSTLGAGLAAATT
jgi:hypothetical protein